ncbi:MAG: MMPL family transporter [Aliiglaciecola sp.]|uniref:MMPL family transporter n=1 Tax=Aliiglaciecola sp. TaxID=1872441 RepID=UPI0032995A6F
MRHKWQKVAAVLWGLTVIGLLILAFSRPVTFDSSIMSLLPKSQQQPLAQQAIDQTSARFSKRLLLLLSGEDETSLRQSVVTLAQELQALSPVSEVRWQVESNQLEELRQGLFPYRFALLDPAAREDLLTGNYSLFERRTLGNLFSPLTASKVELIDDPFGFYGLLSQQQTSDINIQISHSFLKVKNTDVPTYLLLVTFNQEPYSLVMQDIVMGFLSAKTKTLAENDILLRSSGMILHAAAGADQARAEISSIGIGSLIGIILILLMVFRRLKPIVLMLLPVSIGCCSAIAVTLMMFQQVHLITLAFGAGLVGVSIDYALHFVCERQYSNPQKVLPKILPGLLLGLFSSVLAYAVQAFAPFPGLQQMAVFSVVGLIASWLTVVLVFPVLTAKDTKISLPLADKLFSLRNKIPRFSTHPLSLVLLLGISAVALGVVIKGAPQDDIRLLQTSPASLLKQEQSIQAMLGTNSSTQFILVKGQSVEACLLKEQQLFKHLKSLQQDKLIPPFQGLSTHLPPQATQQQNYALVAELYKEKLPELFKKLKFDDARLIAANLAFEQAKDSFLSVENWLTLESSEPWQDLLVRDEPNNSATIIRFSGYLNQQAKLSIEQLIAADAELILIDQVSNISDVMKQYRVQVTELVLLAYMVVLMILVWRYKMQVWRVILPPFLASIMALASITLIEGGMNMFHLLALILVLGIGLDMGIFMAESGESKHTWLAVSLSSFTSLLAFGLLAWSNTPVLHHFGLTVLIGLTLVWLITPAMRVHKQKT